MNGETSRYPVDFQALKKGDRISPETIEEIVGVTRDSLQYALKSLEVCKEIERGLWNIGKPWTVRIKEGAIVILTDPEASEYNAHRFDVGKAVMERAAGKMAAVDVANLDQATRASHDRNLQIQGLMLAGMAEAIARVLPQAARRPGELPQG